MGCGNIKERERDSSEPSPKELALAKAKIQAKTMSNIFLMTKALHNRRKRMETSIKTQTAFMQETTCNSQWEIEVR